jgi:tetratricopeptide (TPR) repeat protein
MCAPERAFEFGGHERTQPDESEIGLSALSDYLIGCERFERGGRLSTLEAIDRFERAARAAPRFALVHAGLGKAMAFLSLYYEARSGQLELARRHCEIAHRIASPSPEAYAAEGLIYAASGDTARSARCFSASLAHRPQCSDTYYLLGRACLSELDFEIGAMVLERAALLRQDDFHSLFLAGKMRLGQGDEAGARADFALAEPRASQVLALHPQHLRALCVQARCLLERGAHDRAHALLDELSAHPDPMNYQVACSYARAGDGDRALDILEEVVEFGWRHGAWLARDPDFARFRDHPRFRRTAASIATASHIS